MANSLTKDLTDKYVLLKKSSMLPKYEADHLRLVQVTGGFGAVAYTSGTALFVRYDCDDEEARVSGYDVDRLVEGEELDQLKALNAPNPDAVFTFTVTVKTATEEQARRVMTERIGCDEDYGFDYQVDWS